MTNKEKALEILTSSKCVGYPPSMISFEREHEGEAAIAYALLALADAVEARNGSSDKT